MRPRHSPPHPPPPHSLPLHHPHPHPHSHPHSHPHPHPHPHPYPYRYRHPHPLPPRSLPPTPLYHRAPSYPPRRRPPARDYAYIDDYYPSSPRPPRALPHPRSHPHRSPRTSPGPPRRRNPNFAMDRFLVAQRTGHTPPPKTIFLVRHGQSTHNAHSFQSLGATLNDARYLDAPLTALGESQARELAPSIPALQVELIVTSPLTRATQTCLHAVSGLACRPPVVVSPLCAERLAYSCDIGSPVAELETRFPGLDYGRVRPRDAWWWRPSDVEGRWGQMESLKLLWKYPPGAYKEVETKEAFRRRVDDFRVWLLQRPETRIIVFAHGIFISTLMGEENTRVRNCELKKWIL